MAPPQAVPVSLRPPPQAVSGRLMSPWGGTLGSGTSTAPGRLAPSSGRRGRRPRPPWRHHRRLERRCLSGTVSGLSEAFRPQWSRQAAVASPQATLRQRRRPATRARGRCQPWRRRAAGAPPGLFAASPQAALEPSQDSMAAARRQWRRWPRLGCHTSRRQAALHQDVASACLAAFDARPRLLPWRRRAALHQASLWRRLRPSKATLRHRLRLVQRPPLDRLRLVQRPPLGRLMPQCWR